MTNNLLLLMPISTETKERIKYIDDGESAISGGVRDLQVQLWKKVSSFIGQLKQDENGNISNKAGNYSLIGQLNAIERDLRNGPKKKLVSDLVKKLIKQETLVKKYFSDVLKLEIGKASKNVQSTLLNRIGYDGKGFVSRGVLRDLWEDDAEIRAIKAQTVKAIASGKSYKEFQDEMHVLINGTPQREGLTEAHYRTATLDVFNQNDRALTKQYADELELEWFIFQGGLMKSTRDFCRVRNNRIFNRKQIESWSQLSFDGKPAVYNPFMDVGGYNCRHVLDPISDEMKNELMKENPEMFQTPDAPPAPPVPEKKTAPKPKPAPAPEPEKKPDPVPKPEPVPVPKPAPAPKPADTTPPGSITAQLESKKRAIVEKENGITRTGRKIDVASINGKSMEIVERVTREQAFESAALYDPTGKMIFFKNGKTSFVNFDHTEAALFPGNILTHNHPGSASFSDADVNVLIKYKIKEMRAVGDQWTYSMKITKDTIFGSHRGLLEDIRYEVQSKYDDLMKDKWHINKEINAQIRKEFPVYADYVKEFKRREALDKPLREWIYHETSNEVMEILAKRINIIYTRQLRHGKKQQSPP